MKTKLVVKQHGSYGSQLITRRKKVSPGGTRPLCLWVGRSVTKYMDIAVDLVPRGGTRLRDWGKEPRGKNPFIFNIAERVVKFRHVSTKRETIFSSNDDLQLLILLLNFHPDFCSEVQSVDGGVERKEDCLTRGRGFPCFFTATTLRLPIWKKTFYDLEATRLPTARCPWLSCWRQRIIENKLKYGITDSINNGSCRAQRLE